MIRHSTCPPLGIMYLTSMLQSSFDNGLDIKIFDMRLSKDPYKELESLLNRFVPSFVGLSALSSDLEEMLACVRIVEKHSPDAFLAAGGPHPSIFYNEVLKDSSIDCAVIGEGEYTIVELIDAVFSTGADEKALKEIKGIAFKNGQGSIELTPRRDPIKNPDDIPFPAWDSIDLWGYARRDSMNGFYAALPYMAIFTSRACPYKCSYCHQMFGSGFRPRSPENVVDEIEVLSRKFGVKEIQIVDDIFNYNIERAEEICDLIVERGIKVKICFPNGLRSDRLPERLIKKLEAAGTYCITVAVETASERLQGYINKQLDIVKTAKAIDDIYDAGIIPSGFFMLGFPTETREEIEKTVDFACRSKMLKAAFFTVMVSPHSALYDQVRNEYPEYEFGTKDIKDLHYWPESSFYSRVTNIDLFKIQKNAYRRFYLNPARVFKILKMFPKNRGLFLGVYRGTRAVIIQLLKAEQKLRKINAEETDEKSDQLKQS